MMNNTHQVSNAAEKVNKNNLVLFVGTQNRGAIQSCQGSLFIRSASGLLRAEIVGL